MSIVANRYSKALFEAGKEDNVLEEVFNLYSSFINEALKEEVKDFLFFSLASKEGKKDFLKEVIQNKLLKNFFCILIDKGHLNEVTQIFDSFTKLYFDEKNIMEVKALSAVSLDKNQKQKLISALTKKFSKEIILENIIDPTIMGGLVLLTSNNEEIDLSVKSKLEGLKASVMEEKREI